MRIRKRLALTVLITVLLNFVLLIAYYNIFLSKEVDYQFGADQTKLDSRAHEIAQDIGRTKEYAVYLDGLAQSEGLMIRVEDMTGDTIFQSVNPETRSILLSSSALVSIDEETYLLKVSKPVSINKVSKLPSVKNLFYPEAIIVLIIIFCVSAMIYFKFVKPLEKLQKEMEGYKSGIRPMKMDRSDEIGKLQNSFLQLTSDLDEEKKLQNRIIASISHDIRTPLTSVMGYAEQLKKKQFPQDRQIKYIDTIYQHSQRIQELIDEFDDYVSYNLQSNLKLKPITARQFCNLISDDYSDELQDLGVEFSVRCTCDETLLNIDIGKIRRVLGNIIGNSLKHVGTEKLKIAVSCEKRNNDVTFRVSDNGIGVKNDDLEKIFEPFYTSDQSRKVAGLGLSICKSIVETHGGSIQAESSENGGLTIIFTLPS